MDDYAMNVLECIDNLRSPLVTEEYQLEVVGKYDWAITYINDPSPKVLTLHEMCWEI